MEPPTTKQEAEAILCEILETEFGLSPTEYSLEKFGVQGGESTQTLRNWARDFHSDVQTEKAEAVWWKKNHGSIDSRDS